MMDSDPTKHSAWNRRGRGRWILMKRMAMACTEYISAVGWSWSGLARMESRGPKGTSGYAWGGSRHHLFLGIFCKYPSYLIVLPIMVVNPLLHQLQLQTHLDRAKTARGRIQFGPRIYWRCISYLSEESRRWWMDVIEDERQSGSPHGAPLAPPCHFHSLLAL